MEVMIMTFDKNFEIKKIDDEGIVWHNVKLTDVVKLYGLNWLEENKDFNRLPKSKKDYLEPVCPNVVRLANCTAGVQAHFKTNAKRIYIDVEIASKDNLSGMTPIARAGFDLYVGKTFEDLKFFGSSAYVPTETAYRHKFVNYYEEDVLCVLNFPLYTGVNNLWIGVEEDKYIIPHETFKDKQRVICYGTSITQGGCASRPGLSYTNLLSRMMQVEWLNYGFSGNAFGEEELIEVLSKIKNSSLFIIDYEANAGTNGKLKLTLRNILEVIRKNNPSIKILVISRIPYLFDEIVKDMGDVRKDLRKFQEDLINELREKGDNNLYFMDGSKIFGDNYHEFTVDTVHPNDLGFMKFSEAVYKKINLIMKSGE
ncbi:MAG: SGNH/GDSL hydrolase family protein [Candidatus Izemoplasmatales bacterium]|nr:SGNH/GDSL hydrolase family protein [Candidatus Izemoplasmatales bacterium]